MGLVTIKSLLDEVLDQRTSLGYMNDPDIAKVVEKVDVWNKQADKVLEPVVHNIHVASSITSGLTANNITLPGSTSRMGESLERNIEGAAVDGDFGYISFGDIANYMRQVNDSPILKDWEKYRRAVTEVTIPAVVKSLNSSSLNEYADTQIEKFNNQALPYNLCLLTANKLFSKPPLIEAERQQQTAKLSRLVVPFYKIMPELFPSARDVGANVSDAFLVKTMLLSGGEDTDGEQLGLPAFKQAGLPFPASARDIVKSSKAYGLHLSLAKRILRDSKFRSQFLEISPDLYGGILGRRDSNAFGKLQPVIEFDGRHISVAGASKILRAPRDIVMLGKFFKAILGPVFQSGLDKQFRTPFFDLQFSSLLKRVNKRGLFIASDYGSYDKTMSQSLIDAVTDMTFIDFPNLKEIARLETGAPTIFRDGEFIKRLPYLANNSGNSGTTYKNNIANLLSTFVVMGRLLKFGDCLVSTDLQCEQIFKKVKNWYASTGSVTTILGDDAFHCFNGVKWDGEAYIDELKSLGWDVKIEPTSFLKKTFYFDGSTAKVVPQLYTTLSNRFSGEKWKNDFVPTVLGVASLINIFEFTGVKPSTATLNAAFAPVIELINSRQRLQFRDFVQLLNYSNSFPFMTEVTKYSSKKDNVPVLNELIRNMSYGTFTLRGLSGDESMKELVSRLSTAAKPMTDELVDTVISEGRQAMIGISSLESVNNIEQFILDYHSTYQF